MATTYRSILEQQPNDGDVVFVRRFTRDPPVLATYLAYLQLFITSATLDLYISGSTVAGTYTLTYNASVPVFALPGWTITVGINRFLAINIPGGVFALAAFNNTSNGFWVPPGQWKPPFPEGENPIAFGANPFGAASRMALLPTSTTGQSLPANLISAWRPQ